MTRILVIEDEPLILTVVGKFLQFEGYEVLEATSAEEGLRLYRQEPTDVVITDLFLPGMSGVEFIEALLGEYSDAKILACAGELNGLALAETAGALKTLPKPFLREELIEAVASLLD